MNTQEDTPPEEVKYWFEYTGPLQVRAVSPRTSEIRHSAISVEQFCRVEKDDETTENQSIVQPKPGVTLRLRTNNHHHNLTFLTARGNDHSFDELNGLELPPLMLHHHLTPYLFLNNSNKIATPTEILLPLLPLPQEGRLLRGTRRQRGGLEPLRRGAWGHGRVRLLLQDRRRARRGEGEPHEAARQLPGHGQRAEA